MGKNILVIDGNTAVPLIQKLLVVCDKESQLFIAKAYLVANILVEQNVYDIAGISAPVLFDVYKEPGMNYHNELARKIREKNPGAFVIGYDNSSGGNVVFSRDFDEQYKWDSGNPSQFLDALRKKIAG